MKKYTRFVPRVRSSQGRNGSHYGLMKGNFYPFRSIVRFGSQTKFRNEHMLGRIEVNSIEGIQNSSNKMKMKNIFQQAGIKSTKFFNPVECAELPAGLKFPVVAKLCYRSGGKGMIKIDNQEQYDTFRATKLQSVHRRTNPYYCEEYVNCKREYRIHVSNIGNDELFSVRKLVNEDVPKETTWIKSIATGAFVEDFDKPTQWPAMVSECKKALKAIKLDIGCFDVKYKKTDGSFYLLEVNSSPAMGEKTKAIYITEIDRILKQKHQ